MKDVLGMKRLDAKLSYGGESLHIQEFAKIYGFKIAGTEILNISVLGPYILVIKNTMMKVFVCESIQQQAHFPLKPVIKDQYFN